MSLFGDTPLPIRPRSEMCCEGVGGLPLIEQFLHALAHSRVPFSPAALAALAGVKPWQAEAEIVLAVDAGAVVEVEPEDYMEALTGLYVGRLARKR